MAEAVMQQGGGEAAASHDDHHYTATGLNNWKVGFWAFIGSECLFFGTLLSTYMVYKGAALQGPFPEEIFDIPLTTVSTFVLLMSSLAMVLGSTAGFTAYFAIGFYVAALVGAAVSMVIVLLGAWLKPERFDWSDLDETEGAHG